ncbi:MAG: hypothetical protein EXR48_00640 [Dehalococcoidia bacterium]|nr:hypothetical protein [Dehalococcoidia bacterium]
MNAARVRELATGELFTGRRAKELGLVDELGDLESVLERLTTELRVPRRRVTYLRPRRPFLRRFVGGMAEDAVVATFHELDTRLSARAMYSQEPW